VQDVIKLKDEIWVSTSSGAYCFDLSFNPKYNGFCFFEGTSISRILIDREGNYWFATLSKGLLFVPNIHTRLYQYQNIGMTALAPFQEGNGVFIGTEKQNILSFSPEQSFRPYFMKKSSNHEIISIYEDTENHDMFFSSNRLVHLNAQQQQVQSIELASKSVVKIKSNLYAMAYSGGVALLTKSKKPVSIPSWLLPEIASTKSVSVDTIFHLDHPSVKSRTRWIEFGQKDSTLYISTVGGLVYISPKGTGFITYRGNPIYGSQIINKGDYTYISTFSEGIYILKNQQVIRHISTKDGLASNTIYRFQIDQQKLWLVEEGMLQSFDLKTKKLLATVVPMDFPKPKLKTLS
jgi:ligand-binding sensor domain-containing protein